MPITWRGSAVVVSAWASLIARVIHSAYERPTEKDMKVGGIDYIAMSMPATAI
jgi:hypothetical protein